MIMLDPSQERLLEAVTGRAKTDEVFRRRLLETPREAIHDAFGVRLPEGFRVRFVEKDPDVDLMVVLPGLREEEDELTEDELEAVAGGTDGAWADPTEPPPPPPDGGRAP